MAEQPEMRSESPFDYHASFVLVPSSSYKEIQPRSCPPQPKRAANTTVQAIPSTNPSASGHPGHKQLATAMNYRMRVVNVKDTSLIRADALTLIEKLTAGKALTRRPREMRCADVHLKLQKIIPPRYFVVDETIDVLYDTGISNPRDTLATAAARYITDLKLSKSLETHDSEIEKSLNVETTPVKDRSASLQSHEEENSVEKTLERLDAWCDELLAGQDN